MRERIVFEKNDRIAVIAPHPDDECLGAAAPLILAPDRTDVFVLTDGVKKIFVSETDFTKNTVH